MRVRWTRRARNALIEIFEHIVKEDRRAAARLYSRIQEVAGGLRDFPYSGRAVPEFPHPGIRQKTVHPFRMIYVVAEDVGEVQILAVLHARRRWPPVESEGDDDGEDIEESP